MATAQLTQSLEEIVRQNLNPAWQFPHKLYGVVVALIVDMARKRQAEHDKDSPVCFTIYDIKRLVFRAYTAPDSWRYLGQEPSLGVTDKTEESKLMAGYISLLKDSVSAALSERNTPFKTPEQLEDAVILDRPQRKKFAHGVDVIGDLVAQDTEKIFSHLKRRSMPPRLSEGACIPKGVLPNRKHVMSYQFICQ